MPSACMGGSRLAFLGPGLFAALPQYSCCIQGQFVLGHCCNATNEAGPVKTDLKEYSGVCPKRPRHVTWKP
jgi:hypothetical protein